MITDTVENIPQWAVCYIEYGDESGITAEEKKMVDHFIDRLKKDGWTMSAPIEGSENDFCRYPAFGDATNTVDYAIYKPYTSHKEVTK